MFSRIKLAQVLAAIGLFASAGCTGLSSPVDQDGPVEQLTTDSDAVPAADAIQAGATAYIHVTTLLNGDVWKTTYPFIGKLAHAQIYGNTTEFSPDEFSPVPMVAGEPITNNPVFTPLALALPGHHYGEHFEMHVETPFGNKSDLEEITLPRWWGPFPRTTEWQREQYEAEFGTPVIGTSVQTNKIFNSTVVAADTDKVVMRSEAEDNETIALPFISALLHVQANGEDNIKIRLDPLENVSFKVQDNRSHLGLKSGHYVVEEVTNDTITYQHHPMWNPYLVGLSFDLVADIQPADFVPPPPLSDEAPDATTRADD